MLRISNLPLETTKIIKSCPMSRQQLVRSFSWTFTSCPKVSSQNLSLKWYSFRKQSYCRVRSFTESKYNLQPSHFTTAWPKCANLNHSMFFALIAQARLSKLLLRMKYCKVFSKTTLPSSQTTLNISCSTTCTSARWLSLATQHKTWWRWQCRRW